MRFACIALLLYVVFCAGLAWAYPTSLNNIPCADTVEPGCALVEFGNWSSSALCTTESTVGVLTQFAIGDLLEFGVDKYEAEDYSESYLNGKFRLHTERGFVPSIAVGIMDVTHSGKPTLYSVASKSIGDVRLHAGLMRGSYAHGLFAGAEYDITDTLWFGADYIPGDGNHLRLGVSHSLGSDSSILLSYGVPNNREVGVRELGLTFSTTFGLGK